MLIELFIASRLNAASNSLKKLEDSPSSDWFADVVFDWAERRALKREMKKLDADSQLIVEKFERPASMPDTSKQKRQREKNQK